MILYLVESLKRLWRRIAQLRAAVGLTSAESKTVPGDGRAAARAQFWKEVREGRLEADARSLPRED